MRIALAILGLSLAAGDASAHTVIPGVSGFPGGMLHPVLVATHAISLVAFGLMIGQQRRTHRFVLLALFVAALAVATGLVMQAFAPSQAELVLLGCGALAALLVAVGRPLPLVVAGVPVAIGGAALLMDSVPPVPSVRETLLSLAGTALTACIVLVMVTGNTMEPKRPWLRIAVRVAGSWCAAAIALILALKLR